MSVFLRYWRVSKGWRPWVDSSDCSIPLEFPSWRVCRGALDEGYCTPWFRTSFVRINYHSYLIKKKTCTSNYTPFHVPERDGFPQEVDPDLRIGPYCDKHLTNDDGTTKGTDTSNDVDVHVRPLVYLWWWEVTFEIVVWLKRKNWETYVLIFLLFRCLRWSLTFWTVEMVCNPPYLRTRSINCY